MRELYKLISRHKDDKECVVVSGIRGAAAGEKLLFADGEIIFKTPQADMLTAEAKGLLHTFGSGLCELSCGTVFVERPGRSERIIVCGAGTVGQEVIKLGKMLGLTVVVLEDRAEYADKAKELGADDVYCMGFEQVFDCLTQSTSDYYIVVTREHKYDKVCIQNILRRQNSYVGMMASRNRARMLKETLKCEGADEAALEKLHSPIGVSIKAETPAEIAVSIFAEIIEHKNSSKNAVGFEKELLEILSGDLSEGRLIIATIVKRTGSAPREVGTKMLIYENGDIAGSVGGGFIEAGVLALAREMFENDTERAVYETDKEAAEAVLCGGYETIYLERFL